VSVRWGDVLARTRRGYDPRARYVCDVCGTAWTWETLVAWDETIGKYVCAGHRRETAKANEDQVSGGHDPREAGAPALPTEARASTMPTEGEPAMEDGPGGVLVPRPAWEAAMAQLGNLHRAGQELAEARERAARAETEVTFLKERLYELRKREADERRAMEAASEDPARTDVAPLTRRRQPLESVRHRIRQLRRGGP
jgi:hypothetical protein